MEPVELRFGAELRKWFREGGARDFLIDPASGELYLSAASAQAAEAAPAGPSWKGRLDLVVVVAPRFGWKALGRIAAGAGAFAGRDVALRLEAEDPGEGVPFALQAWLFWGGELRLAFDVLTHRVYELSQEQAEQAMAERWLGGTLWAGTARLQAAPVSGAAWRAAGDLKAPGDLVPFLGSSGHRQPANSAPSGARDAAAANQITEFGLPTSKAAPSAIVSGPDGNLWFLETYADKIGRITPAGTVTEFAIAPGAPFSAGLTDLTAGADGNLWFTELFGSRVGRLTPAGGLTEFRVPGEAPEPKGIAAGADGNLWFTQELANKIGRLTPGGALTQFGVPGGHAGLAAITPGPDGNLWFTLPIRNRIGRITLGGAITTFSVPTAEAGLAGITAGPDGNLWFAEAAKNRIGRMTPAGVVKEFQLAAGTQPLAIVSGPDGNLWFTQNGAASLGRITPAGVITIFPTPTPNSYPVGIASGPDGKLWFTEAKANKVGRLDLGGGSGVCVPSSTVLCLNGGRFRVQATWRTAAGQSGDGQAVRLTADTGYFTFFAAENVEVVIKVLNACSLNQRFWVFAGGLTAVQTVITVTDSQTGAVKVYTNPQGTPFQPIQSTNAFVCGGASAAPAAMEAEIVTQASAEIAGWLSRFKTVGGASPVGSTYDLFPLLCKNGCATPADVFTLASGAGDHNVTFDGIAEPLKAYGSGLNTTPTATESFVNNGNGTSTLTVTMGAPSGKDLYPSGAVDGGVPLNDGAILIGGAGNDNLDWTGGHVVQSATLDYLANGTSIVGGPVPLAPVFFDAPAPWDGSAFFVATNATGRGVNSVVLRLALKNPGGACVPSASSLCLRASRFRVEVQWTTPDGQSGPGRAAALTSDTGYFWFFGPDNVEVIIKVLDGCPLNSRFWVFAGGLTSVRTSITVTDTKTGAVKTFQNPPNTPFKPIQDTSAFATCP